MTDIYLYGPPAGAFDIILCDPTTPCVVGIITFPRDDKPGRYDPHHSQLPRGKPFRHRREPEPEVVAISLMDNLVSEYGVIHGREVYFAMQREMKGPFAPGNKYDVTQRPVVDVEPEHPVERIEGAPPARRV